MADYHRQQDDVRHAGQSRGGEDVGRGVGEELPRNATVVCGRVGHVDDTHARAFYGRDDRRRRVIVEQRMQRDA